MDNDKAKENLIAKVLKLGPWFHNIEIAPGVRTREIAPSEGPQPTDHPLARWEVFENVIPRDLTGMRVLDIGSADGFFARRGANVVAQDAAANMIRRLEWAADVLGLKKRISTRIGFVDDLPPKERYDFVLCLGLLYHLKHPFLGLEQISRVSDLIYLESAIDNGERPYLYLKPPQPGVHFIPKWFPTVSCIEEMLKYVGFGDVKSLNDPTPNRASFVAKRNA